MEPLVYVIILNYNGRKWIEACLNSLRSTEYSNYRIIFVDNASSDDSVEVVRNDFTQVEIVVNSTNLGYCEGNNIGIQLALSRGADYVVLLNPDTKVQGCWLREIVRVGQAYSEIGILGPVQLNYDGSDFNAWTRSYARAHLAHLSCSSEAPAWLPMKWIEGSCFVVKREVFKAVGLLDPIYVSFYEEVDFCRRAACRGYITALIPRSRFHHYGGGTWRSTPQLKRLRGIRYDHSHLIFSLTDPRKSQLGNLIWYLIILTVKAAVQAKTFHFTRIWDLIRLQPAIFREIGALKRKLTKDRALLEHHSA